MTTGLNEAQINTMLEEYKDPQITNVKLATINQGNDT
jgi:hypothetical protein